MGYGDDNVLFAPAETLPEAISRLHAIAGGRPSTRGEKRALVALAKSLALDVDIAKTNAALAKDLAVSLNIDWVHARYCERNTLNLEGLNALLKAAFTYSITGSLQRQTQNSPVDAFEGEWASFTPATNKLEAVTRIAGLTGAPQEYLGPGGKEHKSVLENLAVRLELGLDVGALAKIGLASEICRCLSVQWTDDCGSTGQTVTLKGLNTVLAGAERRLNRLGTSAADLLTSPQQEAEALVACIRSGWSAEPWRMRDVILEMRKRGSHNYNQMEWQGFYFEERGIELLNEAFVSPPNPPCSRFGNTVFDYRLNRVWDLKAHTESREYPISKKVQGARPGSIVLNDAQAIRTCVSEQGLGFLVLGGKATMDEGGADKQWHDELKREQGISSALSNSGRSRVRKSEFWPLRVEAFWVANSESLDAAILSGCFNLIRQGRQAPRNEGGDGAPRAEKLGMKLDVSRANLLVASQEWSYLPSKRRGN